MVRTADAQRRNRCLPASMNDFHWLTDWTDIPPCYRNKHRPHVSVASDDEVVSTTIAQLRYVGLADLRWSVGGPSPRYDRESDAFASAPLFS